VSLITARYTHVLFTGHFNIYDTHIVNVRDKDLARSWQHLTLSSLIRVKQALEGTNNQVRHESLILGRKCIYPVPNPVGLILINIDRPTSQPTRARHSEYLLQYQRH
jgi:hypothetical protein